MVTDWDEGGTADLFRISKNTLPAYALGAHESGFGDAMIDRLVFSPVDCPKT
jgi:hypothetical protein